MIRLTEIYLTGFRTFANPTTYNIGDGIAVIVGPNRCGKTNLLSSIRWGLGENLENPLFYGAMRRIPATRCTVILTFQTEHGSIQVTRNSSPGQSEAPEFTPTGPFSTISDLSSRIHFPQTLEELDRIAEQTNSQDIIILDEIDAPCDEQQILVFCDKLYDRSQRHQILLVTHSKATMSIADSIIGVTMEEYGVTKLIGMRLTSKE
ncbi:MAG: AAA family ATPase [Akkermansiaceae bacterium]